MTSHLKYLGISLLIAYNITAQVPAQSVPNFSFSRYDKTSFINKDLPAGKMLFFIFIDTDCDHCQHAAAYLNQNYQQYKNAAVYLVSLDDRQKMMNFLDKYAPAVKGKPNLTLLQDTKNEFISRFKPKKYPSMFLYTADKKLADYEDNAESMFRFTKLLNTIAK